MSVRRCSLLVAATYFLFLTAGCKTAPQVQKPDFSKLTEDFVYGSLALSPTSATQAGYHEHQGVNLDGKLDDFSPAGMDAARNFYQGFQARLAAIDQQSLSPEDRADYVIIQNAIDLALQDQQQIQSYRHNPTVYVELIGNALFSPYVLDYAPIDKRFAQIIQRISQIPVLLDQAKSNLTDSPEIWNRVAREENDGNIDLIDKTLRSKVPATLKPDFDKAADAALVSLRSFNAYLKDDLSKKTSDWRLGKEQYAREICGHAHRRQDAGTSSVGGRDRLAGNARGNGQAGRAAHRPGSAGCHRQGAHHARSFHGPGQAGSGTCHHVCPRQAPRHVSESQQPASDSHARVHARRLRRGRIRSRPRI